MRRREALAATSLSEHALLVSMGHIAEIAARQLAEAGDSGSVDIASPATASAEGYVRVRFGLDGRYDRAKRPSEVRHTNRFAYSTEPVAPILSGPDWAIGNSRTMVVTDATAKRGIADVVSLCSQARFCTRELHDWLMASLRFDGVAADGLDVDTLCLPLGGRAFLKSTRDWRVMSFLNRLGVHRLLARREAMFLRCAPAIVAVIGHASTHAVLSAGQLLERVWSSLNADGVAVQPFYVATDQAIRLPANRIPEGWRDPVGHALDRLHRLLEVGEHEMVHMLLRVGRPTRRAKLSARLPLDVVFRDASSAS